MLHASASVRDRWMPRLLAAAAVMAGGALVFRGALGYFFTQDDFSGLARAHQLLPRLDGPWRYLSGQAYFDVMGKLAGLRPFPYHVASLVAHLVCAVLLLAWIKRRVGWPAATLGTMFFAVHPALYTALYSISGIGEILALGFGLMALLVASRPGAQAWWSLPCFALSLLSKESTLLLPAVAAAERLPVVRPRRAPGPAFVATPVLFGLSALSLAYLALFLAMDVFEVRGLLPVSAPYHLAFDATLVRNLLSYLGWTANFLVFTVSGFSESVDPRVFGFGIALLVAWLAGCFFGELRARGWVLGGLAYACFLVPVLPLQNHTNHYYLYAPLAGAALCVAALADAIFVRLTAPDTPAPEPSRRGARGKGSRAARARASGGGATETSGAAAPGESWTVAMVLAALLAVNGALLVQKIERYPFIDPTLRADPTVDRARIAGNAIGDLRDAALTSGTRLLFWSPISIELARSAGRDTTVETYFETNVRGALVDGLAIKLFFPGNAGVQFIREYRPLARAERYAIYRPDGHLRVVDETELAVLLSTMPRSTP